MGSPVFANTMEISSKSMGGKSICEFPDVCFTPPQTPATPPGVPIPYPNTGMSSDTSEGSTSVKIGGEQIMLKDKSAFKKSTGDEAGSAPKKGLINSSTRGKVYFVAWSMDVKVEGENVVRNLDLTTHNHSSPANGAVPMAHTAAVAMGQFKQCGNEAGKIEEKCNGDPKPDPCPAVLGQPLKAGGASSSVGKIKSVFGSRGLSVAQVKEKKPLSKLAKAATTVAEKSKKAECTRAMRCLLRPYDGPKDGVKGCCPGQTPHHIPPWETIKSVSGNKVSHGGALCVCLEGSGHSIGSHGKHHHGINYLLEQASKTPGSKLVQGNNKAGDTVFKGPMSEHVKVSAAVTEAQNGCSKECIEEQLSKQFGSGMGKEATHNATRTGGTSHGLMDSSMKSSANAALARPPLAPPI
jgi:hypothetical protein